MARSTYIWFDLKAYLNDLGLELKQVAYDLRYYMKMRAEDYLSSIPFKTNEVVLADGSVTSDAERKAALIDSLIGERVQHIVGRAVRSTVSAMKTQFEDSHVGLYYEYGTGTKMDTRSTYESLGTPNWPFRRPNAGDPIVTRSKHYDYGYSKGFYMDIGGNLRKSNSAYAGKRNPKFLAYIGEDVEAYHWFYRAYRDTEKLFLPKIKEALCRAHIGKYLRFQRPRIVLG